MKNMCEQAALYFYGEMDANQRAAFKAHLDTCPACRKELAFLEQTQAALVPPAAPEQVVEAVLRKPEPISFWRRFSKPVLAASLIVCLCVGGFVGRAVLQNNTEDTPGWLAYVSDELDTDYDSFLMDFEAFEEDF